MDWVGLPRVGERWRAMVKLPSEQIEREKISFFLTAFDTECCPQRYFAKSAGFTPFLKPLKPYIVGSNVPTTATSAFAGTSMPVKA